MSLYDEVMNRYNFYTSRLLRKAIREVAREQGVAPHDVVRQALGAYKPVVDMMVEINGKGGEDGIG